MANNPNAGNWDEPNLDPMEESMGSNLTFSDDSNVTITDLKDYPELGNDLTATNPLRIVPPGPGITFMNIDEEVDQPMNSVDSSNSDSTELFGENGGLSQLDQRLQIQLIVMIASNNCHAQYGGYVPVLEFLSTVLEVKEILERQHGHRLPEGLWVEQVLDALPDHWFWNHIKEKLQGRVFNTLEDCVIAYTLQAERYREEEEAEAMEASEEEIPEEDSEEDPEEDPEEYPIEEEKEVEVINVEEYYWEKYGPDIDELWKEAGLDDDTSDYYIDYDSDEYLEYNPMEDSDEDTDED